MGWTLPKKVLKEERRGECEASKDQYPSYLAVFIGTLAWLSWFRATLLDASQISAVQLQAG